MERSRAFMMYNMLFNYPSQDERTATKFNYGQKRSWGTVILRLIITKYFTDRYQQLLMFFSPSLLYIFIPLNHSLGVLVLNKLNYIPGIVSGETTK